MVSKIGICGNAIDECLNIQFKNRMKSEDLFLFCFDLSKDRSLSQLIYCGILSVFCLQGAQQQFELRVSSSQDFVYGFSFGKGLNKCQFYFDMYYNSLQLIKMDSNAVPQNANSNCPGVLSEQAGKKQACQGCPNQGQCSSGTLQIDPAIAVIQKKFQSIKHVILVLSGKGGVGKSTVATQLALLLSKKYQVGLLDVDICGPSVPTLLGLVGQQVHQSAQGWSPVYHDDLAVMSIGFLINNPNDAVIWRGPRKNGLIKQFLQQVNWGELDYLIIDTPPGTSDQHLSLVQYIQCRPCDGAIVVTTPQEVALADVRKQLSFCKKTSVPIIGVVQNMSGFVCPNCKCESMLFTATSGGAQKMCQDFECKLLAKIPLDPKVQALLDKGQSILDTDQQFQKDSIVFQQYQKLVSTLENMFNSKQQR